MQERHPSSSSDPPPPPPPPPPPRPPHTPRVRTAAATFISLALILASSALAAEPAEHLSQDKAGGLGSLLGWAVRNSDGDALAAAAATDAGSDTATAARTREQLAADAALLEAALATDGGAADRAASLKAALAIATEKSDDVFSDADRIAAWEDIEELPDVDGDAFAAAGGVAATGAALASAPPAVAHAAAAALASACRNNPKLQALAAADAPRAAAALAAVADGGDPRRARRALTALSALCLGPAPAGDACAAVDAAGLAAGVVVRAAGRRPWWIRVWGRGTPPPPSPVATRAMQLLADLGIQDAEAHKQPDCLEGLARDAALARALASFITPLCDPLSADAAAAAVSALTALAARDGGLATITPHLGAVARWGAAVGADDSDGAAAAAALVARGARDEL